jgi:hypothetical protein
MKSPKADVKSEKLTVSGGAIDVTAGSVQMDYIPGAEYFTVNVSTGGKLTVNDTSYIDTYKFEKLPSAANTDENTSANTSPESVPTLNITGKAPTVKLTGECFKKTEK